MSKAHTAPLIMGPSRQQTAKKAGHSRAALRAVCRNRDPRTDPARILSGWIKMIAQKCARGPADKKIVQHLTTSKWRHAAGEPATLALQQANHAKGLKR
jgi:hypothetical protein